MDLQKRHDGPFVVLNAEIERLDAANAVHLKDAFAAAIVGEDGRILMDLSSVMFMDSSGLGAMVASMKLLEGSRKLELCNLSPAVEKVFKLTRMNSVFKIHPDLETALADTPQVSGDASAA